jgi:large subunit ribosomal protein L10
MFAGVFIFKGRIIRASFVVSRLSTHDQRQPINEAMAKTREQKTAAVERLVKGFKNAKSVAFADYRGLTVPQADELRNKMREANVDYVVAKKTLVNRAAKEAGFDLDAKQYQGMLGIAFGAEDEIAPARVLGDMGRTTSVRILGGIFEGAVADREKMLFLSKLPSKMELLGTVVRTIYAPVSAFVRVLDAIRESREPSAESAEAPEQESTESAEAPAGTSLASDSAAGATPGVAQQEDDIPKQES